MTDTECMEKLKTEGYEDISVDGFAPDEEVAEHSHIKYTIQVIIEGSLAITEPGGATKTYQAGEDMISPAGTRHRATAGPAGCKFIIGVK